MTADLARARLGGPLAGVYTATLPTPDEVDQILDALAAAPQTVADLLARFPQARRFFLERGLGWMAKFGVISLREPEAP